MGGASMVQGTFHRMSPAQFAERIGIPLGWTVISHRWLADKAKRATNVPSRTDFSLYRACLSGDRRLPDEVSADSQYNTGPELARLEEMDVVGYLPDSGTRSEEKSSPN